MKTTCTRIITFDAGHRVLGHEGKCNNYHGHTYKAEITVALRENQGLDNCGRVVDFSWIKDHLGEWINKWLDHNMLLHPDDPWQYIQMEDVRQPFFMPRHIGNSTAENIARLIYEQGEKLILEQMIDTFIMYNVRIWETPNCFADYSLNSLSFL